ncbi:hypothetical protein RRG08_016792 [Elysia crispata]|uniref:Uncharacterized protein n=1 Tax=Elysia crispata TaxID=231223 RepID=A0AAE0ZZ31_9GAST|nr:hypothetical protein RRG08_016792 [Elysia crispata]
MTSTHRGGPRPFMEDQLYGTLTNTAGSNLHRGLKLSWHDKKSLTPNLDSLARPATSDLGKAHLSHRHSGGV